MLKKIVALAVLAASPSFAGPVAGEPDPIIYNGPSLVEVAEPRNPFDGFYAGVSAKYAFAPGTMEYAIGKYDNETWPTDLSGGGWGVYAGYGQALPSGLYLGVEGQYQQFGTETSMPIHNGCRVFTGSLDSLINARARVGFQTGKALLYVQGGYSWGQVSANITNISGSFPQTTTGTVGGFAYGAGVEYALGQSVKLRVEYMVNDLAPLEFRAFNRDNSVTFANQEILAGIGYTF